MLCQVVSVTFPQAVFRDAGITCSGCEPRCVCVCVCVEVGRMYVGSLYNLRLVFILGFVWSVCRVCVHAVFCLCIAVFSLYLTFCIASVNHHRPVWAGHL